MTQGFRPAALFPELGGTGAAQKCATDLDDSAHIAGGQLTELAVNQTLPAVAHPEHGHPLIEGASRDRANGGIHTGGIATAGEDRDLFHGIGPLLLRPNSKQKARQRRWVRAYRTARIT